MSVRVQIKSMVGRDKFLNRKETRAELDRIEVRGGEHSQLMGLRPRPSAYAVGYKEGLTKAFI